MTKKTATTTTDPVPTRPGLPQSPMLADWLARLEARAPASRIELGLERVSAVWRKLGIRLGMPVITVGGTNGKGSVVAMLESMLLAAGLRPLAYSSPHLFRFSERIRIAGHEACETDIVGALERVEHARGRLELTYFEHITLAALVLASASEVEALVLEVGLGGRLDAVNLVDADVAVISSVGIDHAEYLGTTRSAIGREKAGIARAGRPVVVGDPDPPKGLFDALDEIGARPVRIGRELTVAAVRDQLEIECLGRKLALPHPALPGSWQWRNAASAVAALMLAERLEVDREAMALGLRQVSLPGRFQRLGRAPETILDVAHNPAAALALADGLGPATTRSTAVFSALSGKDVPGIARALDGCFTHWLVAPLGGDRGQAADAIAAELGRAAVSGSVETVESVAAALQQALASSGPADRIVVFGSFLTVVEAWPELASSPID